MAFKVVSERHGQEDASGRVFGALLAGPMAYIVSVPGPACLILLWASHSDLGEGQERWPGAVSRPSITSWVGGWGSRGDRVGGECGPGESCCLWGSASLHCGRVV